MLIGFVLILGCSKDSQPEAEIKTETAADVQTSATIWMNPLAIVVPGTHPLWFELNEEGPAVISSPENASLRTFLPWPHSVHVINMLIQENRLVMAVNRLGFLAIMPWDVSRLGMYSVFDTTYWSRYSIASLFRFHQTPSALLYRDDFFPTSEAISPLPETPVMGLIKGNVQPIKAEIPAFQDFSSEKGWDIEALNRGKSGDWYFIAAQKSSDLHEKHYYRVKSLDDAPVSISMGDYWLALEPDSINNAPLLLQNTLKEAITHKSVNFSYLIEAILPNSEGKMRYSYKSGGESDMKSLFVYADDEKAFAVFPDGSGTFGEKNANGYINVEAFALPALPADFFYTGIAFSNDTIIASWEEQQFYGVGAAGFVLILSDKTLKS
jgi:hypothetical protein